MAWKSDKQSGRTFDNERALELMHEEVRDAEIFKILQSGKQVARFDANREGRDLTEEEKRRHPGFAKFTIWHVHTRGGDVEDPERPGINVLDDVILEALTAFQVLHGTAGFQDEKYIHSVVDVKLGSVLDRTM